MTIYSVRIKRAQQLASCFLGLCLTLHIALAQTIEPGESVKLGANEGLALFEIDIDSELKNIRLDRMGSIFSFPKIENLPAGIYTRLLRLPAGEYQFSTFNAQYFKWEFDDVLNSKFRVEAGKINYVGAVQSDSYGFFGRTLSIENRAMSSRASVERDFPGLLKQFQWRYTGESTDDYFTRVQSTTEVNTLTTSVIEPAVEDRDAAELAFRVFSNDVLSLSPDGRFALESVREGQGSALNLIELDTGLQRIVYSGPAIRYAQWVKADVLAIFVSGQSHTSRLLRVRSTTDVSEIPTADGSLIGVLPKSGKILWAHEGNLSKIKAISVDEKIDAKTLRKLDNVRSSRSALVWWIDGNGGLRLAQVAGKSSSESTFWEYVDPKTDERIKFEIKPEKNDYFQIVGFDRNDRILVLTNRDRDYVELAEFDPRTTNIGRVVMAIDGADIRGVVSDVNDRVRAVTYVSSGQLAQRNLTDKAEDAVVEMIAQKLPNRNILIEPEVGKSRRLVRVSAAQIPGDIYVMGIKPGQLQLLNSRAPHWEGRELAVAERFVTKAADQFEIESFLTRLPSKKGEKLPLLVLPHGGPFDVYDFNRFDPEVQYFAKLGFAVLQVNFRGSKGGKAKLELANGEWGKGMLSDIETAVSDAIKRFPVDQDRIVAVGTSYGAYGAIRLAQLNPKRYRAAVGICGVYDLPLLFSAGVGSRTQRVKDWLARTLGDPKTAHAELVAQSPVYQMKGISTPVLLVHDRGDAIAPYEHALRLRDAAKAQKTVIELINVNDNQHGLVLSQTAIATYPKIAKFLRTAIK
jgi:dipeptidyl aminopeptidase/acylaminoacyl peptidase